MAVATRLLGPVLKTLLSGWSRFKAPQLEGRIYAEGLQHSVEIRRDNWGIPHIEAASRKDLFFAQGFIHAQDRLWQMETNRRAARGTLSAVLGPKALQTDRLSRTLGFFQLAQEIWQQAGSQVRQDVMAYTEGVNAYLSGHHTLPIEFSILRYRPTPWEPLDSAAFGLLMVWALSHGWSGELTRAHVLEKVGPEKASILEPFYPAENPVTLPRGIQFNLLQVDGFLKAASGPFIYRGPEGSGRGSNGWVVSARKSATGHAILCNDMHLPLTAPSIWYFNELRAASGDSSGEIFHVSGASIPGMPYVLVGHNDFIAWGATLSFVDCEDLFIEKFHPEKQNLYQFIDTWLEAESKEERITVRGAADHIEKVIVTRHGPIISPILGEERHALALRSTALMSNNAFEGFALINEAGNWNQFVAAVSRIESPSLNLLYADRDDNIGYYLSGRVPIRARGEGLLPAPGWDGEYDWIDFIPFKDMPHALNPEAGYLVTANNRIVAGDYPYFLGSLWMNGYRARRIGEMLEEVPLLTLEDCAQIQMDLVSVPAREMAALLTGFQAADPDGLAALDYLKDWDGHLSPESTAAAVYQVFVSEISKSILDGVLGRQLALEFLGEGTDPFLNPITEFHGQWMPLLLRALSDPDNSLWALIGGRSQVMERALSQAVRKLRILYGRDLSLWRWGNLHQLSLNHVLGQQPPFGEIFSIGPISIGGDMNTVLQTASTPIEPMGRTSVAPTYRQIVDLGNPAQSRAMYAPGQSGWPGSIHYSDLVEPWKKGDYFPMTIDSMSEEESKGKTLFIHPPVNQRQTAAKNSPE